MPTLLSAAPQPDGTFWSAVAHVPIPALLGIGMPLLPMLEDVPLALREGWTAANSTVLRACLDTAPGSPEHNAAFVMLLCLPQLLLRKPSRGGRYRREALARRFAQWEAGEFQVLVRGLLEAYEHAAERHRESPGALTSAEQRARSLRSIAKLVERGEYGKAARRAESYGVASLSDERVMRQMADLHPQRAEDDFVLPPEALGELSGAALEDLVVTEEDVADVFRSLKSGVAPGGDYWRYEYLYVQASPVPFARQAANDAVGLHARFATLLLRGTLPPWFLFWYTAVRLTPLNKSEVLDVSTAPEARPVGIGSALRRAHSKAILTVDRVAVISTAQYPLQLGAGVKAGGTLLVTAIREHLHAALDQQAVVTNEFHAAFQTGRRCHIVCTVLDQPVLHVIARFTAAMLSPMSPVLARKDGRMEPMPFSSEEGTQQGAVEAQLLFNIGLYPHLVKLNAEVSAAGIDGIARAGADDVVVVAPPTVAFSALARFEADVRAGLGCRVRPEKSACYAEPGLRAQLEACRGAVPMPSVVDSAGGVHYGLRVWGVPIGMDGFVEARLASVCDGIDRTSKILINLLGPDHKQTLWALTLASTQFKGHYWLRHVHPALTRDFAQRLDRILHSQTICALGCSDFASDPFLSRRVHLPVRQRGLGLISNYATAGPAFMGSLFDTIPAMLDRTSGADPGVVIPGVCNTPGMVSRIGIGSFEGVSSDLNWAGWRTFAQSASPAGRWFGPAWASFREEVETLTGSEPTGILAAHPVSARSAVQDGPGPLRMPGVQSKITAVLTDARYGALNREYLALPEGSRQLLAWQNSDECARAWLMAQPTGWAKTPNDEWVELACKYLGLPSPALASFVGMRISGTTARVDAYGDALTSALLPLDQFARIRHDPLVRLLGAFLRDFARTYVDVEAFGSIAAALRADPRAYSAFAAHHPGRRLRSFVPDLLCYLDRDRLVEVKTIHVNPSRYQADGGPSRAAVNRRAGSLQAEYNRKAATIDRDLFGTPAGQSGPVQDKLRSYGDVIGVVSGAFGELSDDGHRLISRIADMGADHWRERLLSPHRADARAFLVHHMRMQVGMCGARGNARLLLHRLQFIESCGGGRHPRYQPSAAAGGDPPGCFGADNVSRGDPWWTRSARTRGDTFAPFGGAASRRGRGGGARGSSWHGGQGLPRE